jgi:predicted ATPase
MESILRQQDTIIGPWDEEHIKALLHFPRFPVRIIQQEPWQSWISERGGLKVIYEFLQDYPFSPSHRRILDIVLSNPEAIAIFYADRLNISRATYFYQLRELVAEILQALNHWEIQSETTTEPIPPIRYNLPTPLTKLVGVETTLNTLSHNIIHENIRLLTLLGPGGIGKTRLSIELAYILGIATSFVDLTTLRDSSRLPGKIAESLGIRVETTDGIKKALSNRDLLLILDNFEQILPGRSLVVELLRSLPRLKIIVTSRISLNVYGEYEYGVPPLAITGIETVKEQHLWAQSPAVILFAQRAQSVVPNFTLNNENVEDITELCQLLEGLPLAIELAAYQIKYFSPRAMLERLKNNRLNFLENGPIELPAQQRTIRAMFDWSYNLLPSEIQNFFCQLSVFDHSFSEKETQFLCRETDIQAKLSILLDHSLLEQHSDTNGEPRYNMLGMARDYARDRLLRQQTT